FLNWLVRALALPSFPTRRSSDLDFILSSDVWFRPVDTTVGPDGALYIADWYDVNLSHSNPKNRAQWYAPSRDDGRIYRVSAKGRSEEHTSELQPLTNLVCRLLLE